MLIKYLQVGIINTILTAIVIFIFNNSGINYNISYFIGYVVGFINSFILNKKYTFKSNKYWKKEIIPFLIVFLVSYSISHLYLYIFVEKFYFDKFFAIILSMSIYTITGYILNKKVFLE